jgi:hypothetical protein
MAIPNNPLVVKVAMVYRADTRRCRLGLGEDDATCGAIR